MTPSRTRVETGIRPLGKEKLVIKVRLDKVCLGCKFTLFFTGGPCYMQSFYLQFHIYTIQKWPFSGTYPLIFSHPWSFYMWICNMRAYFWSPYLLYITRSTCTLLILSEKPLKLYGAIFVELFKQKIENKIFVEQPKMAKSGRGNSRANPLKAISPGSFIPG